MAGDARPKAPSIHAVDSALSGNVRAVNAYRAAGFTDYAVNLRKVL
ncbi:MAG: hypothetical protein HC882_08730 [Acidobacteria bacterium]|nr:hypothetical protein [Acidobacteriota bacterium]